MTTERHEFGPALRRERERRGVSLQDVAETTKISAALFEAMERNDFSRWPGGIFRRSFMRAYAEAVGLDADRTVAEFLRLFPADEEHPAGYVATAPSAAHGTRPAIQPTNGRVTAFPVPPGPSRPAVRRSHARCLTGFMVDLLVVGLVGVGSWTAFGWHAFWGGMAVAAIAVFIVSNIFLRRSLGIWLVSPRRLPSSPVVRLQPATRNIRHPAERAAEARQTARHHRAAATRLQGASQQRAERARRRKRV